MKFANAMQMKAYMKMEANKLYVSSAALYRIICSKDY